MNDSEQHGRQAPDDRLTAARDGLITAAATHAPFLGWGPAALAAAARDCDLPAVEAARIFPGGAMDMIARHNAMADAAMVKALSALDLSQMKTRDRVAAAIRIRLTQTAPHREAVRRALALLALPHNVPAATKMLYRTVDSIWRACGDAAVDWNHYSKRMLLGSVYLSTLLFWLDDRSDGFADSFAFLDRRIAAAMQFPRRVQGVISPLQAATRRLSALKNYRPRRNGWGERRL